MTSVMLHGIMKNNTKKRSIKNRMCVNTKKYKSAGMSVRI